MQTNNNLRLAFGANLKEVREARGISQDQLADILGCTRSYISGVENGDRNLSLKSVEMICERIEMDPLTMLRSTSPLPNRNPTENSESTETTPELRPKPEPGPEPT